VETPVIVWHSCGAEFGYRIQWPELMASGIWPWGADMRKLYPEQKYIWLVTREIMSRDRLSRGPVDHSAHHATLPEFCVCIVCIEDFLLYGAINTVSLISYLRRAWKDLPITPVTTEATPCS
jgi:hypothetical protein